MTTWLRIFAVLAILMGATQAQAGQLQLNNIYCSDLSGLLRYNNAVQLTDGTAISLYQLVANYEIVIVGTMDTPACINAYRFYWGSAPAAPSNSGHYHQPANPGPDYSGGYGGGGDFFGVGGGVTGPNGGA